MRQLEVSRNRLLPTVSMGFFHETGGDYVGIDLASGVEQALLHLWEIGCRRIACLVDASSYYSNAQQETRMAVGEERQDTYLRVLQSLGATPEFIIAPEQTRESAHDTLRAHILERGCPNGVFCINDAVADGALRALRDCGLRVPQDVAIVGCDGLRESAYAHPPLSTVAQPLTEMCALAWQFLHHRIQNPAAPPQRVVLPARLVVRESSQGYLPSRTQADIV